MAKRSLTRDAEGWITEYDGRRVARIATLPVRLSSELYLCINLKGCNGSGKSSVPREMIDSDPDHYYLTACLPDKKPIATYSPRFNTIILGLYSTACGGCDTIDDTLHIQRLLGACWPLASHLIFEGAIVGDIKTTFYILMKQLRDLHARQTSFCFMGTPIEECLRRIQIRNGGKTIDESLVRTKYRRSQIQWDYYHANGDFDCKRLDSVGSKAEVLANFLQMYPLGSNS